MHVEQAVFTSTQTHRVEGYQLVAASPGLSVDDRQELSVWGPSHDSLAYDGPNAASVNCFPLASGAVCISKTTSAGGEYSGRGGPRIYTQCLVVPREVLARFANNPFAVLRAAVAQGAIHRGDQPPAGLEAIRLVGRSPVVEHALLTELLHDPGPEWLAGAVAEALARPQWAIATSAGHAQRLIAGLLNCLPPSCRAEISFTTGLRISPRRPFRLVCIPPDPAEIRRVERQHGPVLTIAGQSLPAESLERGWAGYVARVLEAGRTSALANCLSHAPPNLQLSELDAWGDQMQREQFADSRRGQSSDASIGARTSIASETPLDSPDQPAAACHFPRLADTADADTGETESPAAGPAATLPAATATEAPCPRSTESLELLDILDDAVFEAIDCRENALEKLRAVWPQAKQTIEGRVLDESREQYVRQALAAWRQAREQESGDDAPRAAAVLDVLCVVLGS